MKRTILLLCGLFLFLPGVAFSRINGAPPFGGSFLLSAAGSGTGGQRKGRLDKQPSNQGGQFREEMSGFRTRKMVEYLGLTGAEAARLRPAMKALDNNRRHNMESRNQELNALAELLKNGAPAEDIRKAVSVLKAREAEFQDRERVLNGNVLDLLTPEQQAKYFLFNRYFAGEVRKSLYRMAENQGRNNPGSDRQGKPAPNAPADFR